MGTLQQQSRPFLVGLLIFCALLAEDAQAARTVIPLRVNLPPGGRGPDRFPVTTGVPFPNGRLPAEKLNRLRVETEGGKPVAAQFEIRGRYPHSGDVRWLGVDLMHDGTSSSYRLVSDADPAPPPQKPITVTQTADALLVQTGSLKARIPRTGRLLDRVWLDEELLIDQGAEEGNWLIDQDGRRYAEGPDVSEKAVVEVKGPLHTVIRTAGRYRNARGEAAGKWIARLHFYAGYPGIKIVHTFIWLGTQDDRQVRNLALSFGTPFRPERALADRSAQPGSGGVSRPLARGEILALVQDSHWHWGHGKSHFGIHAGRPDEARALVEGERAGHWIRAEKRDRGVTLALKDLWQQYPKELRAEPDRLTCYLWSSNFGGPMMDLRLEAMEKDWGPEITREMHTSFAGQYARWKAEPAILHPHGTAKSHELLLHFSASRSEAEAAADTLADPPLLLPDPVWTFRSGIFGPLGPRDAKRFAEQEARLDGLFADGQRAQQEWGDYGFFFYGSGPHQAYQFDREDGHLSARAWRMQGILYGVPRSLWLAYLRSGQRQLFQFAQAATRFYLDVATCHEEAGSRHVGDWEYNLSGGVIPWVVYSPERGRSGFHHLSFGNFIEHGLLHYYLTGDVRSLDVVREYAGSLKAALTRLEGGLEGMVANMTEPRSVWQKLGELGVLYQQFGSEDEWFEQAARKLARLLFDLESPTGHVHIARRYEPEKRNLYPKYTFYKVPNLVDFIRSTRGPGDASVPIDAREVPERRMGETALVRMAEWTMRTEFQDSRQIAMLMAFAYRFSGNPRFLTYMSEDLQHDQAVAARTVKQTPDRYHNLRVPNKAETTTAVLNTAYYVGALWDEPKMPPRTRLLFKEDGMPAADLLFEKAAKAPLTIELVARGAHFLGPAGKPLRQAWLGKPVAYYRFCDNLTPLLYRTIQVPPEAPEGLYRIRLGGDGLAVVYDTNAARYALAGASALDLGCGGCDPWFFKLAPTARQLRIRSNDPAMVELKDPQGRVHPLPGGTGKYRVVSNLKGLPPFVPVDVPKGADSGFWSIRALNHCRVHLENVVPLFAFARPEAYVVPPDLPRAEAPAVEVGPYVEGLSGKGLLLDAHRDLVIPLEGLLHAEEGTIEFWFRLTWNAPLLPFNQHRQMLRIEGDSGNRFAVSYFRGFPNALEEGTTEFDLAASWGESRDGGGFVGLRERVKWASDSWRHLSFSWKQAGRRLFWALDVDGERVRGMHRGTVGSQPLDKDSPIQAFKTLRFAPAGNHAPFDAVVDNLRISRVARYPDPQTRQVTLRFHPDRRMKRDADTLALFEFEGTPNGRGGKGQVVRARFGEW